MSKIFTTLAPCGHGRVWIASNKTTARFLFKIIFEIIYFLLSRRRLKKKGLKLFTLQRRRRHLLRFIVWAAGSCRLRTSGTWLASSCRHSTRSIKYQKKKNQNLFIYLFIFKKGRKVPCAYKNSKFSYLRWSHFILFYFI